MRKHVVTLISNINHILEDVIKFIKEEMTYQFYRQSILPFLNKNMNHIFRNLYEAYISLECKRNSNLSQQIYLYLIFGNLSCRKKKHERISNELYTKLNIVKKEEKLNKSVKH